MKVHAFIQNLCTAVAIIYVSVIVIITNSYKLYTVLKSELTLINGLITIYSYMAVYSYHM